MVTDSKLLVLKQQLVDRLQIEPNPDERERIEHLLTKIDAVFHILKSGPLEGNRTRTRHRH
jgi:hypothetical protein